MNKEPNFSTNKISSTKASERRHIKAYNKPKESEWRQWWKCNEGDIGLATETIISKIENEQSLRFTSFINWARLYGNWEAMSWGSNILNSNSQDSNNEFTLRLNLIQSVIDSAAAKIAKDSPQPYFITAGGDYFTKLKAEKLTKYVRGVFQQNNVYEKAIKQFRDAGVYGTGALHFYILDDKIECDWVPTFELRVADYDGMTGKPKSMHRVRMMNKEDVIARFPDKEDEINQLSTNPVNRLRDYQSVVEMVRVKESWHLKSSKNNKRKDGVYAFTINDKCLVKEDYTLDEFPIITFDWMPRALGFFGRSITEEVYSVQMSIDELLNVASQSYSMVGMPIIFVPDNAQIPEDVILSNFIARLIPYRGDQKPSIETPEPLPQSFFNFLQQHIQWVFQIVGLSQTTATSQNQLGPDASGAAIRELVDIETTRFAQVSTRWEDNFVKIAHTIVNLSKQLYEKGMTDLSVDFHYKKMIDTIKWKDVNIDCSFDCKCDPVSQLPDSTAGRIQTIQEYIDRQWISKERGMEMLNLDPDLQQEVNIQTSSLRLCEKRLSEMVEEGKVFKPEPYMNLQQALDISKGVYNMLVIDGCPEDRLQLVRDWMNDIITLQASLTMQQPPPPSSSLTNGAQ